MASLFTHRRVSSTGISTALLCCLLLLGCKDEPAVKSCEPGGGLALDNRDAPVLGDLAAPVDLTVFGDLQCPYTEKLLATLSGFYQRLTVDGEQGELKIFFRHLLRSNAPGYRATAISIAAAQRQGNEFIWGSESSLGLVWCYVLAEAIDESKILECADQAGLDMERFSQDRQAEDVAAVVERDLAVARDIGFEGVPGVVLCGVEISSDPDEVIDNLEYLID